MISAFLAAGTAALAAVALRPVAPMLHLVDEPDDDLKHHARSTPITGGLAVVLGLLVGWVSGGTVETAAVAVVLALFLLGLVDDIRPLSPGIRLVGVALIAGGFAAWSADVAGVGAAVVVTVVIVVAVNAVNLLDGADGVAGSAGFVSFAGLAALASSRGLDGTATLVVAGAVAGFLAINWPPARVFLGDGGAYAVGGLVVWAALVATPALDGGFSTWLPRFAVAVSLSGVFLVDLLLTVVRRARSGARLTAGDRLHIYDRMADRGWPAAGVALAIGVLQVGLVAVVWLLDRLLEPWPAALASVAVLVIAAMGAGVFTVSNQPLPGETG